MDHGDQKHQYFPLLGITPETLLALQVPSLLPCLLSLDPAILFTFCDHLLVSVGGV